jgi:hypothetical protein
MTTKKKIISWADTQREQCQHVKVGTYLTPSELATTMLRDFRFKKIMLASAEQVFWSIPPEVKLQLFKEAAKDMLNSYQIRDVKELYSMLGKEVRAREDKIKTKRSDKHGDKNNG